MWLIQREPERAGIYTELPLLVLQTCAPLQEGLEGPPDTHSVTGCWDSTHSSAQPARNSRLAGQPGSSETQAKRSNDFCFGIFFLIPGEEELSHLTFFPSNTVTATYSHLFFFKCLLKTSPELGSHSASEPCHVVRSSQSKYERNIQSTPTEGADQLLSCLRPEVFRSQTRNLKL